MVSTIVARGRSMDERLKSLRSLHQMICIAAAAVLAFAMTPDRSKEYRAALDELEAFRKVDLKSYPVYVKRQFVSQEKSNRALVVKAAKQAHLTVRDSMAFSEPLVMDAPPLGAFIRLRDFEAFVTSQHTVGIYLIDDEREVFARLTEQLVQKAQQPTPGTRAVPPNLASLTVTSISETFGSGMSISDVQMADPVVLQNSPNMASLFFSLYDGLPLPPSITFSVGTRFEPSGNTHLALDWLRSDENGRKLVDSSGVVFPKLKPFWERIADMGADNATLFLQERIEATTRGSLSLFGVSVDRDLVLWAGPLVLFSLMLFLWLHLRQANGALSDKKQVESSRDYPWVVCFRGRISGAVSYSTVIGVPLIASVLLLFEHGERNELSTKVGVGWTVAALIIGGIATWEIHQFRARISESAETLKSESEPVEQPSPAAPSAP